MIYSYDKAAQIPLMDLYNTLMMLAEINAAKDMYEKGLEEMKDFRKEYGDFLSPIQSDMDWYDQNVTGKVKDVVNDLYAHGIDPVRSAEGRAAVTRAINSINIGAVAQRRQAAKDAEQYKKSRDTAIAAGIYNENYERAMLGGQTLEEWDGSKPWTATQVHPYLDYEQKYKHLFDKMDYEYDPEESAKHPGMDVMTKNKDRMHQILSANIPDLQNDPQYRYDLQRMSDIIKSQNPELSDLEISTRAQQRLHNEIVERNYKGGMKMEENPIYKKQLEIDAYRQKAGIDWFYKKLERANTPGYDSNGNPTQLPIDSDGSFNFGNALYESGVRNMFGFDPGDSRFGSIAIVANGNSDAWREYKKRVLTSDNPVQLLSHAQNLTPTTLAEHLSRTPINKLNNYDVSGMGVSRLTSDDKSRIIHVRKLNVLLKAGVHSLLTSAQKFLVENAYKHINKEDFVEKLNVGFYTDTDLNRGVVTGFTGDRHKVETFVPIILIDKNGNVSNEYYYNAGISSKESSGGIPEFDEVGISTVLDSNTNFGNQLRNPGVEQKMRVKGSDLTSTSVNSPY